MKTFQISNSRLVTFSINVTVIIIMLLLSLFVSSVVKGPSFLDDTFFERYVWYGFLLNCIYFYLCYAIFQQQNSIWWQTILKILLVFCISVIIAITIDMLHIKQMSLVETKSQLLLLYFAFINVLVKSFYLFVTWFTYALINFLIERRYYNKLKLATLESELSLLKSQTNPHFLFNSLNSLYASSYKFGDYNTAEAIAQMSAILRYMLHKNQLPTVSIQNELEHIEDYIALQKFRYQEKLSVNFSYSISQDLFIAPMLMMPLIENAFKYGVITNELNIIEITLVYHDNMLIFSVSNFDKSEIIKQNKNYQDSGLGLNNLRQRLELIYSNRHKLEYKKANEYYIATLELKT